MNKMWSIHIPDYSATKGNDILKNAEMWTNLINTKLRKSNQTEKVTYYTIWFYLYEISRTDKSIGMKSD